MPAPSCPTTWPTRRACSCSAARWVPLDDDAAPVPAARSARCCATAVAAEVPTLGVCLGAPAAGRGQRRPGRAASRTARRSARSWSPSAPRPRPTRCSGRCRSPRTSCSGTSTRSRAAARRGPAGQLARLRAAGVPARPAGLGHPVPHRDDAGDGARVGRRGRRRRSPTTTSTRSSSARSRSHDDIAEVWQPFAAAFADIVRDPAAVPAPRARADVDGGAGDRSGRDPRRARRRGERGARPRRCRCRGCDRRDDDLT